MSDKRDEMVYGLFHLIHIEKEHYRKDIIIVRKHVIKNEKISVIIN